jgi:hypothetical protein
MFGAVMAYYIFDINLTTIFPGCMFLRITGLYCPGCGGTRALQCLLKGDVLGSVRLNFITLIGVAIFLISFLQYTIIAFFNKKIRVLITYDILLWSLVISILAFWVIRNIF